MRGILRKEMKASREQPPHPFMGEGGSSFTLHICEILFPHIYKQPYTKME